MSNSESNVMSCWQNSDVSISMSSLAILMIFVDRLTLQHEASAYIWPTMDGVSVVPADVAIIVVNF